MKRDIVNREDIAQIVRVFYEKVKEDALLSPIFLSQITHWDAHLEKITNFWEQSVFMKRGLYYGHPIQAHLEVDAKANYVINPTHFGQWLYLWINTINDMFEGELADIMKNQARKMQTAIYLKMFEHKPKNNQL
jgi:hemoglobin